MPPNVFANAKSVNEIFRDETALYPDFLPEQLLERDSEINELVFALKPASEGKKPSNIFVHGSPGTGKTASVRWVLQQLSEFSGKTKSILVNCFEANSRHSVLSFLAEKSGAIMPKRGVGSDEIYAELLSVWKRTTVMPIIVLDEADHLLSKEDGSMLLYDLVRAFEREKILTGVIIVSNDSELLVKLDSRVKSSLLPKFVEYSKYSPEQLKKILSSRAKLAFFPETLDDGVISIASGHAAKMNGDCRLGIEALLAAGRLAEKQNSQKVLAEHLKKVFADVDKVSLERRLQYLSPVEIEVLKCIARHPNVFSGDLGLFVESESKQPVGERMFRNIVAKLDQMGLIKVEEVTGQIKGKSRRIGLKVNADKVKSL